MSTLSKRMASLRSQKKKKSLLKNLQEEEGEELTHSELIDSSSGKLIRCVA